MASLNRSRKSAAHSPDGRLLEAIDGKLTQAAEGTLEISAQATFDVEAAPGADGQPRMPTFTMVANTGAPMRLEGWRYPVVLDMTGANIPSQTRPIRLNHDASQGVGHSTAIAIQGSNLLASGVISRDTPAARDVAGSGKNGFPWQASVGAKADSTEFVKEGQTGVANGETFAGPINLVRKWTLGEISFVDLGADSRTSAAVAASDPLASIQEPTMSFEAWVQAKGFNPADLTDQQKSFLRAQYDAENGGGSSGDGGNANANGNATNNIAANGGASGGAGNGQTVNATQQHKKQTLDQILAEKQTEQLRVDQITAAADEFMNERPAHVKTIGDLARVSIDSGASLKDFQLAVLTTLRPSAAGGPAIHAKDAAIGMGVIEAAICRTGGLPDLEKRFDPRVLEASDRCFRRGIGLVEVLETAARANCQPVPSRSDHEALLRAAFAGPAIRADGFSTVSLPGILSNTANKFLVKGFTAVESAYSMISGTKSVKDFKTNTSYSLTGGFKYKKVGPTGELKHATVGETTYTVQADTYGVLFAITRKDIINDDLGALTEVPERMGRGAALELNEIFWTEFLDNATFFATGNNNFFNGTDSVLSIDSLTTAEQKFFDQTDPDGNPVAIPPRFLLVPNGLNATASQLMRSTEIRDTTTDTRYGTNNPHAGKFEVVRSSYLSNTLLTGFSTTAWYLLADPADLPVIQIAYLNGRTTPIVESAQADFDQLGIRMRAYHDFGVSKQEFRAGVKSKGTA